MKKGAAFALSLVTGVAGAAAAAGAVFRKFNQKIDWKDKRIDKFKGYFDVTNQWISLKNQGHSLEEYFTKNGYKNIAIYGMGELGNRLAEELEGSSITAVYGIDKNAENVYSPIELKGIDDELPPVDVIVVTPFFIYDEVEELLMDRVDYPVVSIEDVVFTI